MAKRKAWKWVLGLFAGMGLILGGIVLDAHRRAGAILDRERAAVKAQVAAWLARDHTRPPGLAEPIDGNAWDDYGPALAQLAAMPSELTGLLPRLADSSDHGPEDFNPDDHAIQNVILEYRPALEQLRRGARRRTVHPPAQTLSSQDDLQFGDALLACKFLADIVAHEHRMGRDDEALAASVLPLALAQDYGRSGTLMESMLQFVGEDVVLEELKIAFEEGVLGPAALAAFAAELNRLDASRPDFVDCWKGTELVEKLAVIDADWDGLFPFISGVGSPPTRPHVWPSWRALFSERITRAQAAVLCSDHFGSVETLRPLPPWKRIEAAEKIDQGIRPDGIQRSTGNLLLDARLPSFTHPFQRDAAMLLQRTLLRLAVALSRFESDRGRPADTLQDLVPTYVREVPLCPLTGLPLQYRAGKVWSLGTNRLDDGGRVDPTDSDWTGGTGDVVWTVKSRK